MTNKLEPVKAEIRKRLYAAGVKRCLDYPEQIGNIGNFLPFAMLRSESCDVTGSANMCMIYDYNITIYICTQTATEKTKAHEDFVFKCYSAIYASSDLVSDNRLGGTASLVLPNSISFDDNIPYISDLVPQNAIQTSSIRFTIQIEDNRYD